MSMKLIRYACPVCGDILNPQSENSLKCRSCGSIWEKERLDDYEKIFEKFDIALREQRQKEFAALVKRRYQEVNEEYVSNVELERICNKILDLNPEDFFSRFYLATCKEDYSLENFLCELDVKEHLYAVDYMLDYLIRGLQARWINSVSSLIENAYKSKDVRKYDLYRTKFEKMAEKVENCIFEPTLSRDIFIAYSSRDMQTVNELLRILEEENELSCFVAARNLRHGSGAVENYRRAIETAIRNCKAVVFVSSTNSRSLKCEAMQELIYIKENLPKMWRIELLTENYRGVRAERIFTDFFDGLEYCTSASEAANRYFDKLEEEMRSSAKGEADEKKKAEEAKRQIEEETRRKLEAEFAAKLQAEAEARRKLEAEFAAKLKAEEDAKRKAELEAEIRRKIEAEAEEKRKAEAEAKLKAEAEEKRKAELEAEIRRKIEAEAEEKRKAEAEEKRKAEAEAKLKAEAEAKLKAEAEAEQIGHKTKRSIQEEAEVADFEIENGVLKKYIGSTANVVIPNSVTAIGESAFYSNKNIVSVDIPESVTSIGKNAFWSCKALSEVTVPGSVATVGDQAFSWCDNLKNVTIEYGVKAINMQAFYKCIGLTSVTIPESVASMGNSVFNGCESLTSITIPSSVTAMGINVFKDCGKLKTIYCGAPRKPTAWDRSWFGGCKADIVWAGNQASASVATPALDTSAADFEIENGVLKKYNGTAQDVVIPSGVTAIGEKAFWSYKKLTSITIPSSVTTIGDYAFSWCDSLVSVNIQGGVTSIGKQAFYRCGKLSSITLPNTLKSIGNSTFNGDTSLSGITIPASVTTVGVNVFDGCTGLKNIYCEASAKSAGWSSVFLGGCKAKVSWGNKAVPQAPSSTPAYTATNYSSTDFDISGGVLRRYRGSAKDVVIPNGVTSVGREAFKNCKTMTSVTMPDSVTFVDYYSFAWCSNLKKVNFGRGLKSIGNSSFVFCISLESITIPISVETVDICVFQGCDKLKNIYCEAAGQPSGWKSYWLNGCNASVVWGSKESAQALALASIDFDISGGVLTKYKGRAKDVVIPVGVTSIGEKAFYQCKSVENVTIPSGVTSIGNSAFHECGNLKSVSIPEGVVSIGKHAFCGCTLLDDVVLPGSVQSLDHSAFAVCNGLTSIIIPSGVTTISPWAFYSCNNLETIFCDAPSKPAGWSDDWLYSCPANVVWGGKKASFANSSDFVIENGVLKKYKGNATDVVIPGGVTAVGEKAFYECKSVEKVTVPNTVKSFGTHAFCACPNLTNINIPSSVTTLGHSALAVCKKLTSITIPASVTNMNMWVFYADSNLKTIYCEVPSKPSGWDAKWLENCPANVVWKSNSAATAASAPTSTQTYTAPVASSADFEISGNVLKKYRGKAKNVVIPNGVTAIGLDAFDGQRSITSVTIPNSVTSIENGAFRSCAGLTSITIPASVTSLGHSAFALCTGLTSVTVPAGVSTVKGWVFYGCTGLKTIYCEASGKSAGWSNDWNHNCAAKVLWSSGGAASYTAPASQSADFVIENGVLTKYKGKSGNVVVPSGVTAIGEKAFYECKSLTSITIPASVTSIGSYAFGWCNKLTSVSLASGLKTIGNSAFVFCSDLTSINIPNSVTSIAGCAFQGCGSLASITIPNSVTSLEGCAFSGCNKLKNIYCKAAKKPAGWSGIWLQSCSAKVVWGYKG